MDEWKYRSEKYDKLQWVNNNQFLAEFLEFGNFKSSDLVLDVGTGTGKIAKEISPLVNKIMGIDDSISMLDHSHEDEEFRNVDYVQMDARDLLFNNETFDKATCRYVLHHITEGTQRAVNEIYRVLKGGGSFLVSEGIPPTERCRELYGEIFALKEQRLTIYEADLVKWIKNAGFASIETRKIILKGMSIRNWLDNSGLSQITQDKIFYMHMRAPEFFKEDYCMKEDENDCYCDFHVSIVKGIK